jgi:hypothetical protein
VAKERPVSRSAVVATALPTALTQARRFAKARSVRVKTLHEDYVELIASLLEMTG